MQTEPHKTARCREQRDPNIEAKTRDVPPSRERPFPVSAGTATPPPGLRPRPGSQGGAVGRDHGRGRLGTLSLLASIDLPAGEATSLAGEMHKSPNHAGFLGITGGKYPRGNLTRVMPGDVSVRASAETRRYLATVPGRFEFVSAPRHGSRPDLVEGLFSRMTRQMLRGIRVSSKDEPEERILRYFREADAEPVVCRWRWNLSDVDPTAEELVVDTLLPDGAGKAS